MEETIKDFFERRGKWATEHLGSGANVLITIGETSYTLKITEEREVSVEKDGSKGGDIEIKGEEDVMNDLFSSSDLHEFTEKMNSYIGDRKAPQGKIHMERTVENTKKFLRTYFHFFRKIGILK